MQASRKPDDARDSPVTTVTVELSCDEEAACSDVSIEPTSVLHFMDNGVGRMRQPTRRLSPPLTLREKKDGKVVGLSHGLRMPSSEQPPAFSLEQAEADVHATVRTNPILLFLDGNIAACKLFLYYLVDLNTIVCCSISIGLTLFWYISALQKKESGAWGGGSLEWALLSFAVVMPMAASINMAFQRRELALFRICQIRSFAYQLYLAHTTWDWNDGSGRETNKSIDWLAHTDEVLNQLVGIGDELCRFLTLPTASRGRHRALRSGRNEAGRIMEVAYALFDSASTRRITKLTVLAERLKSAGLSSTEASRIRQYERYLGEAMENLRTFKIYRTPQALRAFARLFTNILPPLFAPAFAYVALEVGSLVVGIILCIITTLALTVSL